MDELLFSSIERVADALRQREISPVELTNECFRRIEQWDSQLRAFASLCRTEALAQAHTAEHEIANGKWRGALHGVPIAVKDLIDINGAVTSAASRVLASNIARRDAEIVRHLKNAGAVLIGKTNLHEFAFGGSGVVSAFGPVANPWDLNRTTGGSSSGSAAALAAGMCFAAIGTDTAGSIRVPASYCGLVGLMPTYGLVSIDGVIPLSKSLDHVGPIARSVRDGELVLEAISNYKSDRAAKQAWRIGVARKFFFDDLDPAIAATIEAALNALPEKPTEFELPINVDRSIFNFEVWNYHRKHVERTPELYDPRTLARIKACSVTTAAEYDERQKEAAALRLHVRDLFREVDVILTPTSPINPPPLADLVDNPDLRAHELIILRNTRPINVLRLPTVTLPCGLSAAGLPVGLQITAATDRDCMAFAKLCEQTFAFTRPPLPLS